MHQFWLETSDNPCMTSPPGTGGNERDRRAALLAGVVGGAVGLIAEIRPMLEVRSGSHDPGDRLRPGRHRLVVPLDDLVAHRGADRARRRRLRHPEPGRCLRQHECLRFRHRDHARLPDPAGDHLRDHPPIPHHRPADRGIDPDRVSTPSPRSSSSSPSSPSPSAGS